MMSFPLLLLLLLPVALMQPPLVSGFQYGRCFQKLERHSIDNSQPLTEIFRSPALDCLEQCIAHTSNGEEQTEPGPLCRAVVYDHLQHSCRLFGHDGRKVPAVLHPANGFDLYRRTASSQECAGPVKRLLALQSKKNLLAAPSQQVNAEGGKGGGGPIPLEGGDSESPLNDHELSSLLDQLGTKNGKGGGHHSAGLQSDPETADEETAKSASDCGAQVAGFFAFPGGQREEEGTEEFLGWSQRQCAEFCTENEGPDGETFYCVGFSHSPGGGKCRLHRRLAQGELSLQSIGGGLYAEKWCIPAHRFGLCRKSSQFKIHLQQRFHPQCVPIAVLENIPTLADCLRQCLDHLGCQSVSFYAPARRCQLHREQPLTDLVEPTDDQGWTLAENGCHERKGPVGLVDSEDGQLEREVENQQQQPQQLDLAVGDGDVQGNQQHARAFGQATNIVAAADCVDGGGRLSQILLGKRSKK